MSSTPTFNTKFKQIFEAIDENLYLKTNFLKTNVKSFTPKNLQEKTIIHKLSKEFSLLELTKHDATKPLEIFIFGAGGTTSWFLPKLVKILNIFVTSHQLKFNITIIDGDKIEAKNLVRQNFISDDIDKFKAQVLAERYSALITDPDYITISYINKYVFEENVPDRYEEFSDQFIKLSTLFPPLGNYFYKTMLIFNLVDNEGVKKDLDLFISETNIAKNGILYFSTGLNLHNGQIYVNFYSSKKASKLYNSYTKDHVTLLHDFETLSLGCAEATEEDIVEEQLINGNDLLASALANSVFNSFYAFPTYKFIELTFSPSTPLASTIRENYISLFTVATNYSLYLRHFRYYNQNYLDFLSRLFYNKALYDV